MRQLVKPDPKVSNAIFKRASVKYSPTSTRRLLKRIRYAAKNGPSTPVLVGLEFVRHCRDLSTVKWTHEADSAWTIYISHDQCHDTEESVQDRNTVLAVHRDGTCRVIGCELPWEYAIQIAQGYI